MVQRHLPLVAWVATLVIAIALFGALGAGQLAAPPLTEPSTWGHWVAAREPAVATTALLRLVVLALAWYLVGVTTIGAIARLADLAALVRVADALSVPVVRRVLQTSLGVGLATAVVATSTVPAMASQDPPLTIPVSGQPASSPDPDGLPLPWTRPLGPVVAPPVPAEPALPDPTMPAADPTTPAPDPVTPLLAPGPRLGPVLQPVGGDQPGAPTVVAEEAAAAKDGPSDGDATWTVRSGDHLWGIAATHLEATIDAPPSRSQVARYWQRLVDANRHALADPGNPDLILPGQQFVLPAVDVAR